MLNENLFRAARTENVAKRRFLLIQVVKDVLWGDSEIQEACNAGSSDWQTGDHLGNISMSVWNCRAPAGGTGVCEGEAGGGERNPPPSAPAHGGPRPKASVALPLLGSVSCQVCVLRECKGKRRFNHNFFLINHNLKKFFFFLVLPVYCY